MSDVKWIKIVTDIFDDEKILLIESMPESDCLIVIWFKIICLAGRINNGGVLMLNDSIAYTDEMLATVFRRNVSTVRLALKTFESLGMILIVNNTITIPNWSKHQSLDRLEKERKYHREYMREQRKKQSNLAEGKTSGEVNKPKKSKKVTKVNHELYSEPHSEAHSKTHVKALEGEVELEREEEVDKEIYRNIVAYLNEKTGKNYKYTTRATKALIDARTREGFDLDDFKKVIDTKVASWKGDTKMSAYLRPNTLFGSKFESYLNEKSASENTEEYGW